MAGDASFWDHEMAVNPLVSALLAAVPPPSTPPPGGDLISLDIPPAGPSQLSSLVGFLVANWEHALLLVPQSVSIEGKWTIDDAFASSHVAICDENGRLFVTRDGIWGRVSLPERRTLQVCLATDVAGYAEAATVSLADGGPPHVLLNPLPPLVEISAELFVREAPRDWLKEQEAVMARTTPDDAEIAAETGWFHVLREGSVELGGKLVSVVLISDALEYVGAPWRRAVDVPLSPDAHLLSPNTVNRAAGHTRQASVGDAISDTITAVATQLQTTSSKVSSVVGSSNNKTRRKLGDFLSQFGAVPDGENPLFPLDGSNASLEERATPTSPAEPQLSRQPEPEEPTVTTVTFFQTLQRPEAADVVKLLRTFVTNFLATMKQNLSQGRLTPMEKQGARIHRFVDQMREQVLPAHKLWRDCDPDDEKILEGVEKYCTTKLYGVIFRAHAESGAGRISDQLLDRRLTQLRSFLKPEHFDLDPDLVSGGTADASMKLAAAELHKINDYKAPRDKLVCILNCCKVAYSMLKASVAGADEFLPVLIWIVIFARPPRLATNLEYISAFRSPEKLLVEEMGYYFTQLQSAVTFVYKCDASVLTIDPEEFAMHMILNDPGDTDGLDWDEGKRIRTPPSSWQAVADVEPALDEFAESTSASLALGDVPRLLIAYKKLLAENKKLRSQGSP